MKVVIEDKFKLNNMAIRKGYSPFISSETLTWWEWDPEELKFVDTGRQATLYQNAVAGGYTGTEDEFNLAIDGIIDYLKDNQWLQNYKGTVTAYADLPTSGVQEGDVYMVLTDSLPDVKAGDLFIWTSTGWDRMLSAITDSEIETIIETI